MHRTSALVLVLAALLGVGVWLLLRGGPAQDLVPPADVIERTQDPGGEPTAAPGALEGAGPAEPSRPLPAPSRVVRPEDVPRGTISLQALAPDGAPYLPGEARIYLEPVTRSFFWTPTGIPDPQTGTWRFEKIPAGRVRARVTGDHVVEASAEFTVAAGQETSGTLHADRAGAVAYKVVLYSGEAPPEVTLTLLDVDKKPVKAAWQVRAPGALTSPRVAAKVTQAAEGIVFGLAPGRYRLRAESPAEEWDEADVDVAAGQTLSVEIRLRE